MPWPWSSCSSSPSSASVSANSIGSADLPQLDDGVRIPGRVLQQVAQPRFLEAQADAEHEIGVGDLGDVPGARLEPVRVGADGDDAEDLDVVAAHVRDPVRDDAGRDDDADGGGGLGAGRGGIGAGRTVAIGAAGEGREQREGEKQDRCAARDSLPDTASHLSWSCSRRAGSHEPTDHFLVLSLDRWSPDARERCMVCQPSSPPTQRSQVT